MTVDITLMRRNWRIVQKFWLEVDGWSAEDVEEARVAIKKCADSGDDALLECWFNYLAETVQFVKSNPDAIDLLVRTGGRSFNQKVLLEPCQKGNADLVQPLVTGVL